MKLVTLIMVTAILQVSANTYAQKVTLSEKNAPLTKIFNQISQQSGFDFLVTKSVLDSAKPVTVKVTNAELKDVLNQIFENQPLEYEITAKSVLVREKAPTILDRIKTVLNIQVTITGTVLDENNKPLAGVTVKEKGTSNAAITDQKGLFVLNVPNKSALILVSFIGYETQEIMAGNLSTPAIIQLRVVITNLKEIVVNKGYYNTTRELNTGNVSSVSAKEIAEQPVGDPLLTLQGRVAGLYIAQTSGVPGAVMNSIQLRGQNSIANGNNPLFIVDGVPFTSNSLTSVSYGGGAAFLSPFSTISTDAIESIEVLKDADATAIYGSRGANGVILITTKKGKAGKTKLDFNLNHGVGNITRQMDLMNTQQYLQMRHEAFKNDGATPQSYDYDINGSWDTTRNTNWQKMLIGGTSKVYDAQASISGGTTNTQFLLGGGYRDETTVFPGDFGDKKASFHVNINHTSDNQRFKASFSGSYVNDNSLLPTTDYTNLITLAPDAPALYGADGKLNWQNSTWTNPFGSLLQKAAAVTDNLSGNMSLGYQLLPGLEVKSSFGYNKIGLNSSIQKPLSSFDPAYASLTSLRSNRSSENTIKTWIIEPQISYYKKFGESQLNMLVGTTFQENIQNVLTTSATNFTSDDLIGNVAAAARYSVTLNNYTQYKYNAIFARANYSWKEKYLLNLTGRRDGSSRFGPEKQFGNFGAAGAGWIFSKEDFIKNSFSFLSFGKLRASYGITGNDQLVDYQYLSTYTPYSYTYLGQIGLVPARLPNSTYGWEKVSKLETGIELGFFNDHLLFSASYYRNRTNNQLVGYSLPAITGFTSITANLPALIQNTGIELEINSQLIKDNDFSWNIGGNITFPQNKLLAYPNLVGSSYANIYVVGKSLYIQKLLHYTGLDNQTGVYTFQDLNKDGQVTYPEDIEGVKQLAQTFFGGLQNNFKYKRFQLDIFIQFVKQTGRNYLSNFLAPGIFVDNNGNQPTLVLQRWQKPGDNTGIQKFTQDFGSAAGLAYGNANQISDYFVADASFVRLKNVAISYQLPLKWLQSARMQNVRIYLQGQNLLTVTKYKGLDPETQGLSLPPLRMITAGIQFTF